METEAFSWVHDAHIACLDVPLCAVLYLLNVLFNIALSTFINYCMCICFHDKKKFGRCRALISD